jgi:hypothetical protein
MWLQSLVPKYLDNPALVGKVKEKSDPLSEERKAFTRPKTSLNFVLLST